MAERVQPLKPLVAVHPNDTLAAVVRTLFEQGCSMAPVLANSAKGEPSCARRRGVVGLGVVEAGQMAMLTGVPYLEGELVPCRPSHGRRDSG